jgi:SAM-dependent methyltransferase
MSDKQMYEHFEEIYKGGSPGEIPWNSVQPPELLVELVESGQVKPGRALDLGCGLGNYAIWLAGKGFDVVGVDASPTAIKIAKRNARLRQGATPWQAKRKKGKCKFLVADLTGEWPDLGSPREINNLRIRSKNKPLISRGKQFDFVYDWGLLHHIMPENRGKYIENVNGVLKTGGSTPSTSSGQASSPQGGKYLSMCFNERDTAFEGTGKYRQTSLGTAVYLSSEKELRGLFGRFFKIIDFRVLKVAGKIMTHIFNYCFMERKGD